MKHYSHIIWDFNGTVYNDVDACIRSANRLLTSHGLSPLTSVEQYRSLFGFPIIEYYARLGFDFAKTPYDALAVEWVDYYMEESRTSHLYDGVTEVIDRIAQKGISQIILSATEAGMLRRQLDGLGILSRFDEVLGQDNIHAYGKSEIAGAWCAAHPDATVLMLGDTEHDAEVAALMGADCILLTCGHRPRQALQACNCLAVADAHQEILKRT